MKPTHITFVFLGITFKLPIKFLRENNTIQMDHVATASVIKQYIKAKYPELVVSTKSNIFSGGNSVDVYVTDTRGKATDKVIFDDIKKVGRTFQEGSFNGMIDMYENDYAEVKTDDGKYNLNVWTKYVSIIDNAKFGSREWILNELDTTTKTKDEAIADIKYYCTEKELEKAMHLL